MPIIRYYTVTQKREVKIAANSAIDAAVIADAEFNGDSRNIVDVIPGRDGRVTSEIRVRDLVVQEDY